MSKIYDIVCWTIIIVCCVVLVNRYASNDTQYASTHSGKITAPKRIHSPDLAYVAAITQRYKKVPTSLAFDVVRYTKKYERKTFPKQADLLALIAIESSFRPHAKSNLKRDPAIGLTQIRPGKWRHKFKRSELHSIENQIKYGAEILAHNYSRVKDPVLALHAYNLGLTAALRGDRNPNYVQKFKKELKVLTSM